MKCFIVSMGIIIMGISGIVFEWDMQNYSNMQFHLKALTESCAECGALSFNDSFFNNSDDIVYDNTDVLNNMNYFLSHASSDLYCFQNGVIEITDFVADSDEDFVKVTIQYTSDTNLFRLVLLAENKLQHTSCYQWHTYD